MSEAGYIRKRKFQAAFSSLCFYICRVFPIKPNLISVCSFEGKGGFGCNPKYIVQEIHDRNPEIKFVWFVNDMTKCFPDYIRKVPNTLWSRAYWLSRSKVWIDNYRKPYGTIKRKEQCYINTWHATVGFKSIGKWRGDSFSEIAYLVSDNDSRMIDKVLIDSEWCREMYPKGLIYGGEFLWAGAPRDDVLYGNREKIKRNFRIIRNLPDDAKIIMYAPTFREKKKGGKRSVFSREGSLDGDKLLKSLSIRFGGNWYLCIRAHPQLINQGTKLIREIDEDRVIDVSHEDDMNELLAAMDAFITDYSSAAMEAGFCRMPVFIYADDIKEYVEDRGSLLWNLSEDTDLDVKNNRDITPGIDAILPYPIAKDNEELAKKIIEFDEKSYNLKSNMFERNIKLLFDGKASSRTADYIEQYILR